MVSGVTTSILKPEAICQLMNDARAEREEAEFLEISMLITSALDHMMLDFW